MGGRTRPQWLWECCRRLTSSNLCTLGNFVERRVRNQGLGDCPAKYQAPAPLPRGTWVDPLSPWADAVGTVADQVKGDAQTAATQRATSAAAPPPKPARVDPAADDPLGGEFDPLGEGFDPLSTGENPLASSSVPWAASLVEAVKDTIERRVPLVIFACDPSSAPSLQMLPIFSDPLLVRRSKDAVWLKLTPDQANLKNMGIVATPTVVFFDPGMQGMPGKLVGVCDAAKLSARLDQVIESLKRGKK
jgi:hypothetical protein